MGAWLGFRALPQIKLGKRKNGPPKRAGMIDTVTESWPPSRTTRLFTAYGSADATELDVMQCGMFPKIGSEHPKIEAMLCSMSVDKIMPGVFEVDCWYKCYSQPETAGPSDRMS